jgi:hypothetical protein
MAASYLIQEVIDGQNYWYARPKATAAVLSPAVHLLPNYDEYIVGYKDRSAAFDRRDTKMENPRDSIVFSHTILIEVRPFASLSTAEDAALASAVQRYGEFHDMPVTILNF